MLSKILNLVLISTVKSHGMSPGMSAGMSAGMSPGHSASASAGHIDCSQFTCGADCHGSCGWSSIFNKCMYGFNTSPHEMSKGPGCSRGMGMGSYNTTRTTYTTLSTTLLSTSTTEQQTAAQMLEITTHSLGTTTDTSPKSSTESIPVSPPEYLSETTTTKITTFSEPTITTTETTSESNIDDLTLESESESNSEEESSNESSSNSIAIPTAVALVVLVLLIGGVTYRRKKHRVSLDSQTKPISPVNYEEVDEDNVYLAPTLLKDQGMTRHKILVNDAYSDNSPPPSIEATYDSTIPFYNAYELSGEMNDEPSYFLGKDIPSQEEALYGFARSSDTENALYDLAGEAVSEKTYDLASN